MEIFIPIAAVIIILAGFVINYFINRRRFNRRNVAGLQQFSSYEKAVGTTALERLGKLIARLLILGGLFLLVLYYFASKRNNPTQDNTKVQMQPSKK